MYVIGDIGNTEPKICVYSLQKKSTNAVSIHTKNNNIIDVIPEAKELGFVGVPNGINNNIILNILKDSSNSRVRIG